MSKKTLIILVAIIVVLGGTVAGLMLIKNDNESKAITTPKDGVSNLPIENNTSKLEEKKQSEQVSEIAEKNKSNKANDKYNDVLVYVYNEDGVYEKLILSQNLEAPHKNVKTYFYTYIDTQRIEIESGSYDNEDNNINLSNFYTVKEIEKKQRTYKIDENSITIDDHILRLEN